MGTSFIKFGIIYYKHHHIFITNMWLATILYKEESSDS